MTGATPGGIAVENLGEAAANLDLSGEVLGIDGFDRRRVDELDAGLSGEAQVALLVARVAVEILARPELGRVDEEAHDDQVALGAGGAQQREVALMEEAHRRHQANRAALAAHRSKRGSKLVPCAEELHVASCV